MTKERAKQRAKDILGSFIIYSNGRQPTLGSAIRDKLSERLRLHDKISDALLAAYREGQESMKPKPKPCERCGKLSGSVFCSINCYAESEETL
jgi:hypothetical protein